MLASRSVRGPVHQICFAESAQVLVEWSWAKIRPRERGSIGANSSDAEVRWAGLGRRGLRPKTSAFVFGIRHEGMWEDSVARGRRKEQGAKHSRVGPLHRFMG